MTSFIIVAAVNQRKNKYQDIYTKLNVQYKTKIGKSCTLSFSRKRAV